MSVLVTDASGNHALATIRSLGQNGVRVVGADSTRGAKSLFSRYCAARAVYPSPTDGVGAFHTAIGRILDRVKPAVLMPMTERTILALVARREDIESRGVALPLPSEDALRVAFDKKETIQLAKGLGVAVPRTFSPSHVSDVDDIASQVSYPAVIKPRTSEVWTVDDRIVPSGSVEYCADARELTAKYQAVHRRAPFPLIQEFVPGEGYGISVLCNRGRLKALFAHRRLRMIHPTGSGSSLRESVTPPPRMVAAAWRLLDALEWHGVAMVEFKLDRRDDTPTLMEINGRFWNSLPLAVAAGVDFPLLLYQLANDGDIPDCFGYRVGVRSRWLVGDARHLVEVLRGRPAGWRDEFPSRRETLVNFMKFTGPDLHYDDFWLSDPVPFFADSADFLFHRVPKFIFHRRGPAIQERERVLPAARFHHKVLEQQPGH